VIPGIVKFDGDTLHWAFAVPSKDGKVGKAGPRPTAFDSKAGIYFVLKRAGNDDTVVFGRRESQNNLKLMALSLHNYHDANKAFPPAGLSDESGKPLLSWRVALLPYLDQLALYEEFDLTKPWDDPHNKKLIAKMPKVYLVPGTDGAAGKTHYRALVGPGTVLEPLKGPGGKLIGRNMLSLTDGTSNTILLVEANEPIEWTRPDDLPYNPKGPLPKFGVGPKGFNVVMADGRALFIPARTPEAVLRPYLTGTNGTVRQALDDDSEKDGNSPKDKGPDKDKSFKPKGKEPLKDTPSDKKPPTDPDKGRGRAQADGPDRPTFSRPSVRDARSAVSRETRAQPLLGA
jgi:hypothetical protein